MFRLSLLCMLFIKINSFNLSRKYIFRSFMKYSFDPNLYIQNNNDDDDNKKKIIFESNPTDYELLQLELLESFIPLTPNQETYYEYLNNDILPIIVVNGPTGTGKSLFAVNKGYNDLKDEIIEKIVIINPLFDSLHNSDSDNDITNNIKDILMEYCSEYEIKYLMQNKKIIFESLKSIRGMTFKNSFVICEDMENSTIDEMLMLITRIGTNTRIVINGNTNLISSNSLNHLNGLSDLINKIKTVEELNFIKYVQMTLEDIQRNPFINNILKSYNQ